MATRYCWWKANIMALSEIVKYPCRVFSTTPCCCTRIAFLGCPQSIFPMQNTKEYFVGKALIYLFLYPNIPSHRFIALSKSLFDLAKFILMFHPIFYITAITANIANNRDFPHKRKRWGVNVVPAGMAVLIIRHTHNIPWMALRAASYIFHRYFLLVI